MGWCGWCLEDPKVFQFWKPGLSKGGSVGALTVRMRELSKKDSMGTISAPNDCPAFVWGTMIPRPHRGQMRRVTLGSVSTIVWRRLTWMSLMSSCPTPSAPSWNGGAHNPEDLFYLEVTRVQFFSKQNGDLAREIEMNSREWGQLRVLFMFLLPTWVGPFESVPALLIWLK